jgi:hypothetical protein
MWNTENGMIKIRTGEILGVELILAGIILCLG